MSKSQLWLRFFYGVYMLRKAVFLGLLCSAVNVSMVMAAEDAVVVAVGDIKITQGDVKHYIGERISAGLSPELFITSSGLSQSVENILSLRRLGKMAREAGFVTSDQIEWEIELYRERLQYREWVNYLVEKEMASTDWNTAAREEYIANPAAYSRSADQIRVSHILVSTKERSPEDAKKLAEELLVKIKSGSDFEETAIEYSEDQSVAQNKGDLGFFEKDRMVPAFGEAAFELSADNKLSGVVETEFGFHIIKFIDRRKPGKLSFDAVRDDIIANLKAKAPASIREKLVVDARSVSPESVTLNEDVLKALELELLNK